MHIFLGAKLSEAQLNSTLRNITKVRFDMKMTLHHHHHPPPPHELQKQQQQQQKQQYLSYYCANFYQTLKFWGQKI